LASESKLLSQDIRKSWKVGAWRVRGTTFFFQNYATITREQLAISKRVQALNPSAYCFFSQGT
jgi:hypothetical protein